MKHRPALVCLSCLVLLVAACQSVLPHAQNEHDRVDPGVGLTDRADADRIDHPDASAVAAAEPSPAPAALEVHVLRNGEPLAERRVEVSNGPSEPRRFRLTLVTDLDGRARFEDVPPGVLIVRLLADDPALAVTYGAVGYYAEVAPGQEAQVKLGESGRRVAGVVRPAVGVTWPDEVEVSVTLAPPDPLKDPEVKKRGPSLPDGFSDWSDEQRRAWRGSIEGAEWERDLMRVRLSANKGRTFYRTMLDAAGAFRFEDVLPGEYALITVVRSRPQAAPLVVHNIIGLDGESPPPPKPAIPATLGRFESVLEVPAGRGRADEAPIDLGVLDIPSP